MQSPESVPAAYFPLGRAASREKVSQAETAEIDALLANLFSDGAYARDRIQR